MGLISVVINTLNEEANLRGCLESVLWADEIVIVDMHSTDRTVAIAEEFGCKVFQHARIGYVEPARNFALEQATQPWILVLDADERISSELADWIKSELAVSKADAFRIPRRNFYGGTWVTCCGWFPDDQVRLFRRGKARYSDRIHRAPEIDGVTESFPFKGECYLLHYAFADLSSRMEKNNIYSTIAARAMADDGRHISAIGLLGRTLHSFISPYIFQKGYRFGILGIVLSGERAFANFLKYAKLWEINHLGDKKNQLSGTVK